MGSTVRDVMEQNVVSVGINTTDIEASGVRRKRSAASGSFEEDGTLVGVISARICERGGGGAESGGWAQERSIRELFPS